MTDPLPVRLDVTLRDVCRDDLRRLEWFGMLTRFRASFDDYFERYERGEILYLVAEMNRFPVGQILVDVTLRQSEGVALIWAFRIMPNLHNLGIGSWLIRAAEQAVKARGFRYTELGCEHFNIRAKRLYDRLGYEVIGEKHQPWTYTTPEGITETVDEPEWIMRKAL